MCKLLSEEIVCYLKYDFNSCCVALIQSVYQTIVFDNNINSQMCPPVWHS